jgi:hypothetical protein
MKKKNHVTDEYKSESINLDRDNPKLSEKIKIGAWLNNEELDYVHYTSLPETDYMKMNLQLLFIENERFKSISELVNEKFKVFIEKLIKLSPHKEKLENNKLELLYVFYNMIYQRIIHDTYLMNAIEFLNHSKKEIEKGINSIVHTNCLSGILMKLIITFAFASFLSATISLLYI